MRRVATAGPGAVRRRGGGFGAAAGEGVEGAGGAWAAWKLVGNSHGGNQWGEYMLKYVGYLLLDNLRAYGLA